MNHLGVFIFRWKFPSCNLSFCLFLYKFENKFTLRKHKFHESVSKCHLDPKLGPNSQNILRKISKICITSGCFCKVVSCNRAKVFDLYCSDFQTLIILTLKIYLNINKRDILRLKVTKNIKNLP